jgi:predicted HAD superfamily Cof-like phosphohydrolase
MSSINDVARFQEKFGFIPNREPNFLAGEQMKERLDFLLEELKEFAEACGYYLDDGKDGALRIEFARDRELPTDLEKALDGLVDLSYVTLGTANMMGFHNEIPAPVSSRFATIWWEAWTRVHKANMAKKRVTDVSQSKRGTLRDTYKPAGWVAPSFKDLLNLK